MRIFEPSVSVEPMDVLECTSPRDKLAEFSAPRASKSLGRCLLTLAMIWSCSILAADDEDILHDRFEFRNDFQGPTIQISPPENWAISNSVSVTFQDPSGLATRATRGLSPYGVGFGEELTPFFSPTTEATLNYFFRDFNNLLGDGSQVIVVAQDVYGNFSRESTTFVVDSPIRTGFYVLDVPFRSDPVTAEYCDFFSYDPETIVFEIDTVEVLAYSSNYSGSNCSYGSICLQFLGGGLVGEWLHDGSEGSVASVYTEVTLEDLDISEVATPINLSVSGSRALGSSVSAIFFDEEPRRLTADFEMHCFTARYEEPLNGCPITQFQNCDVDTFGPFSVEATLQPE